jgi:hypothetical protein
MITEYGRGMRSAVLFISEMLGISNEVYKDLDDVPADEISAWILLARLCGQIEAKTKEGHT